MTRETMRDMMADATSEAVKPRLVANNTVEYSLPNGDKVIRLHHTDIVTFKPSGAVILNSGGWQTVTTKDRLNRFAPVQVYSIRGIWHVSHNGNTVPFADGLEILPSGRIKGAGNSGQSIKLQKEISKFVKLITKDNLPQPDNGDCWFCLMFDREQGGDDTYHGYQTHQQHSSGSPDHLREHLSEGYLTGSLLVNAMRCAGYRDEQIGLHYQMKLADTFKRATRRYLKRRLGLAV